MTHATRLVQDADSDDELRPGPRYHVACSCGLRTRPMEFWAALMARHVHEAAPGLAPFFVASRAEALQNGNISERR